MFDHQGYSEAKIARLCDRRAAFKGLYKRKYMTTEMYSLGRYYREYAGYPEHLPLYVYSQHGLNYESKVTPHELENDAEAMLVFNPDKLRRYQSLSDKPCHLVTCPNVRHRRRHGIVPHPEAKGTLVFPAHSTREIETGYDVRNYIQEIKALPAEFQPVCVQMHVNDIRKGGHRPYMENGLPVYTAGDTADVFFGDRLYEVLRHFKYTMSNEPGSYAYLSVEMGIPFSLWGEEAKAFNLSDPNLPKGDLTAARAGDFVRPLALFSGIHTRITPEQKEFVEFSLGVHDGISGEELGRIFREAYQKRGRPALDRLTAARYQVEYGFKRLLYGTLDT